MDKSDTKDLGGLLEWRKQVDERLDSLDTNVSNLLNSEMESKMLRKSVKLAIFVGLLAAICVLLVVCFFVSPSAVKEILPLLIESLKYAIGASR